MRSTSTDTPSLVPGVAPSPTQTPTAGRGAAWPETVMVCQLISGDLLVQGIPEGALVLLIGSDADPLRTALDAALDTVLTARPGSLR